MFEYCSGFLVVTLKNGNYIKFKSVGPRQQVSKNKENYLNIWLSLSNVNLTDLSQV